MSNTRNAYDDIYFLSDVVLGFGSEVGMGVLGVLWAFRYIEPRKT